MRNILLPTDGSTPALVATIKAVDMAKERGVTLIILKVVETAPIVDIERIAVERHTDQGDLFYLADHWL